MSKPFHVYLDLDVFNNSTDFTAKPPQLSFEETRTQPFLDGTAEDYFVAIARFSIQTGETLPVFIPAIDTTQSDPNLTVYKITLMYRGISASVTVIYTPQPSHDRVSPPNGANGQDFSGNYYYIYNYQDWITMVNTAFLQAHVLLKSNVSSQYPTDGFVSAQLPPFLQIDLTTLTCVLNADATYYDTSATTNSVSIYFNTRLHQLLAGFPSTFLGYSTDTYTFPGATVPDVIGDRNFQIRTKNNNYANTLAVNNNGTTQKYIQAFQEINSVGLWNPVAAIVFTSTTLPIHPTLTSPPKIYNNNSTGLVGAGTTNLTNILSDFEIAISNTNQYRPEISYAPPGEYRLIDMYSNSNLSKIDLNVYWKDRYGNLKPLRLQPGCSASVKLLFRHKHFYLGAE